MNEFLEAVRTNALTAGVFSEVNVAGGRLQCAAANSAEPAWYRVEQIDGEWNVSLVTADRWLSESIEADLMHSGDPLEELIEEELVELGYEGDALEVKHYRSEDKLYTFRSPLPMEPKLNTQAVHVATQCLLAYEAAFRELGDMTVGDE